MIDRFSFRLARREARSSLRRIGVFLTSITLGVGALVAVHSFRVDVTRSIRAQATELMGADLRLTNGVPIPDSASVMVDSVVGLGAEVADVTTALSMVLAPRTGVVRLLQVKGVEGRWPFYGSVETEPASAWGAHLEEGRAIVDPAVLVQLGVTVGDSLVVGDTGVRIVATVTDVPTDLAFQTAVGPRVWISGRTLDASGLLTFGSLARYERYLRLPDGTEAWRLARAHRSEYRRAGVDLTTAREQARDLTRALDYLGRYLGLVGLGALLLGGIGVASAVHVYVREKIDSIAVLRCIGASQSRVFSAYVLQAVVLGLGGAVAGVAVGLSVQQLLPHLLADALPVAVEPRVSFSTIAIGVGVGAWISVLFALGPLLQVRDVPPLLAFRRDFGESEDGGHGLERAAVYGAVLLTVVGLSVYEAPSAREGVVFALGLVGVTAVLAAVAAGVVRATRRLLPGLATYPVRQGVSNLFRPRNQTLVVTLVLGFGVFVVGTVSMVQTSLARALRLEDREVPGNLLLFDIQVDQVEGIRALLPPSARDDAVTTPLVPARIAALRGRTPEEIRRDTTGARPARWALRRDYRHTYRWDRTETEEVVGGVWFSPGDYDRGDGTRERPGRVSLEEDLARDLGVGLGDRITWDVGGREVHSVITSLRRVEWESFSTNFFVVFEPGVLESAPHTLILLASIPDARERAELQAELVGAFPNVSAVDLARVQEVVSTILEQVGRVVRFLAFFSAVAALIVLVGALGNSREQRAREAALLRTLGARRGQILRVFFTEYAALGVVAAVAGLGLATLASGAIVARMFELDFFPSPGGLASLVGAVVVLTVATGMLGSRRVLRRPPLAVLRRVGE